MLVPLRRFFRSLWLLGSCLLITTQIHATELIDVATDHAAVMEKFQQWKQGKKVLTLVGFSGAGYQDELLLEKEVSGMLANYPPDQWIINIGATPEGIGRIYPLARSMGYTTTGIVSSQAVPTLNSKLPALPTLPPDLPGKFPNVDYVMIVVDEKWGGFINETRQLSPTSKAMVAVSDAMFAYGGGGVGRDEMIAALLQVHKPIEVRFFEFEMKHAPGKDDVKGALFHAWEALEASGFGLLKLE
ncbi:hypothetical protein ACWJJH_02815 [Endozoicomonadaceae bacterium StTr2]